MMRTILASGLFLAACTVRSRDDTPADTPPPMLGVQTRTSATTEHKTLAQAAGAPNNHTHAPARDSAPPRDDRGYDSATQALNAISACFANEACSAESRANLGALELLALDVDPKKRPPVPNCTHSVSSLVLSGFCGMMSDYDVEQLREGISGAVSCLAGRRNDATACTERERLPDVWMGIESCSTIEPGEIRDLGRGSKDGPFSAGQPWAIQVSRVTIVAWAICLEGVGDRVTGFAVGADFAAE
jgi:hypothetical protein